MHMHVKVIQKSSSQSILAKGAYNNRTNLTNLDTGEKYYHQSRGGLVSSSVLIPDNSPQWLQEVSADLSEFFSYIQKGEKRKDAQIMREVTLALPHELNEKQTILLAKNYVKKIFVDQGMVVNLAIHKPNVKGDPRNIHAHILLTMREILPDGFGKKVREWNTMVPQWRDEWERLANSYLSEHGFPPRIEMKSYERQALDKVPIRYTGPSNTKIKENLSSSKTIDVLTILRNITSKPRAKDDGRAGLGRDR